MQDTDLLIYEQLLTLLSKFSPETLGQYLAEQDSNYQAKVLNAVGKEMNDWLTIEKEYQTLYIVKEIDEDGKSLIYRLANWLKVNNLPDESPKFDYLATFYKD